LPYALHFDSHKLWVAQQLEVIASRYQNHIAEIVAQQIRDSIDRKCTSLVGPSPNLNIP